MCGNGDDDVSGCVNPGSAFCIPSEQCDDGPANSDTTPDACRSYCFPPSCGDSVCDPGHGETCGSCPGDCGPCVSVCGNGVLENGEQCDDGNLVPGDCCDASCLMEGGVLAFSDNFEGGAPGWTSYALLGLNQWGLSNNRASSGATSFWTGTTPAMDANMVLESPPVDLSLTGPGPYLLSFKHWYDFDDCNLPGLIGDASFVEVSTDGGGVGGTWSQVYPVSYYPFTSNGGCGGTYPIVSAYMSDNGLGAFESQYFDMSAYVGMVVNVRFNVMFDCANCVATEAWYLDDVQIFGGCAGPPSGCGDLYCDAFIGEDCASCPGDCGACPVCDDLICQSGAGETCAACPADCGICAFCGDGICQPDDGESSTLCVPDCFCGDGVCDGNSGERPTNCPPDCLPPPVCGDGICSAEQGENAALCPPDCYCGDTVCNIWDNESCMSCPDCACGGCLDAQCDPFTGENQVVCPECFCGDGICNPMDFEDAVSCPPDCQMIFCGDGICNPLDGENTFTCAPDCSCGDMVCDFLTENFGNCPVDCAP